MTGSKSNLRSNGVGVVDHADVIMRDDDDDDEQERFRDRQAATSAREEERRKVLEIEEERIRLEREAQLRRNGGAGDDHEATFDPFRHKCPLSQVRPLMRSD